MTNFQAGILAPIPQHALYLHFQCAPMSTNDQVKQALNQLTEFSAQHDIVVGFGSNLLDRLNVAIPNLRNFPAFNNEHITIVRPEFDLWCWLCVNERGELLQAVQRLQSILNPVFTLNLQIDAFKYQTGRDLTGYEDGTENPEAEAAIAAAIYESDDPRLHGSSFVVVQQWQHNFLQFNAMSEQTQNHIIGRRRIDNEELEDAPESAHVKRTAQENFEPEAFVVRRSMPWMRDGQGGLYFVAFGHSFDAFEAQFRKMLGLEDGISDALFQFSTPLNNAYFWCPPKQQGRLNLSVFGIQH
ncbi:Dyp-type peroxidase [Undibacterium sp. Di24W]|uniref:Dyp-type peroxidase n=1 Tax=Undibacterium sp. Di24W TaxID=3413033 RepID=UPI003BF12A27